MCLLRLKHCEKLLEHNGHVCSEGGVTFCPGVLSFLIVFMDLSLPLHAEGGVTFHPGVLSVASNLGLLREGTLRSRGYAFCSAVFAGSLC